MEKKNIMPSKALLDSCVIYDENTGELIWRNRTANTFTNTKITKPEKFDSVVKSWNTRFAGKKAFNSIGGNGYRMGSLNNESFAAHQIIWKLMYDTEPDYIIHLDGNKLNNRLDNLKDRKFADIVTYSYKTGKFIGYANEEYKTLEEAEKSYQKKEGKKTIKKNAKKVDQPTLKEANENFEKDNSLVNKIIGFFNIFK